jgi:hypothetical protein
METIVVGTIEFLNRKAIIHSIDKVYKTESKEDKLNQFEGFDYLIVERYQGNIEVTKEFLINYNYGN